MVGRFGFKVSLIKAFQPHLLVFYGKVDYLSLDLGIWFYTLIMPALIKAGIVKDLGIIGLMTDSEMLNPTSLFGIKGLGKWGNSLFWSMFFNLMFYIGVSVFTKQSKDEEIQSLIFVESYEKARDLAHGSSYSVSDIEDILAQYLGRPEAKEAIHSFLSKKNKKQDELTSKELFELRNEAEKILSGAIGSSMASIIFENKLVLTEKERGELSESIKHITESLRLSRQELADANRELSYLKEFSENIIESAPVGITTVDSLLKVKYWNKEMETITGIKKSEAFNSSIILLLPWIPGDALMQNEQNEIIFHDTGVGIEESVIDKIFDPFFTTKPFGKGTGLGLSICYGIIREHNGTITVKSKKGEGTTFVIKLPIQPNV